MPAQPGPALAVALVVLLAIAVLVSWWGRLGQERKIASAALRATVQLAVVALVITAVLGHIGWSILFGLFMCAVATFTSSRRIEAPRSWPWVALAIGSGVVPTLAVIFASGAVPFTGASLVPVAGIIIGGAMTASSLTGRRVFAALRDDYGTVEAGLAIGLHRPQAIDEVISDTCPRRSCPAWTRPVRSVWSPCPVRSSGCCWAAARRSRQGRLSCSC